MTEKHPPLRYNHPEVMILRTEDLLFLMDGDRWSNAACKGYVIKACRALDYTDEQTSALLQTLDTMFSTCTVEEAEKIYRER